MTGTEFKQALKRLGWKQSYFSRKVKISTTSISLWSTDKVPIPDWVEEYLKIRQGIKDLSES